jgi:hypothetical protein
MLRSFICLLLGLPLVIVLISIADPFLGPVRESPTLRKIVYTLLSAWMVAVSAVGMGVTFRRQAREILTSHMYQPGCLSSSLMAANGIVLLLAVVTAILMLVRG